MAKCGISSAGSRLVGKENIMILSMPHAEQLLLLQKSFCVRVASCHPLHLVKL